MRVKSRPDNLIAGEFLTLVESAEIVPTSDTLLRGAVLGRIKASGKYTLATAGVSDGSEIPTAILAEDVPAGESLIEMYTTGIFSANHVILGEGIPKEVAKEALHTRSIFLVETR